MDLTQQSAGSTDTSTKFEPESRTHGEVNDIIIGSLSVVLALATLIVAAVQLLPMLRRFRGRRNLQRRNRRGSESYNLNQMPLRTVTPTPELKM